MTERIHSPFQPKQSPSIARTKQAALTHNVRGKELTNDYSSGHHKDGGIIHRQLSLICLISSRLVFAPVANGH